MNRSASVLLVALAALVLMIWGCGDDEGEDTASPTATERATPSATPERTATPSDASPTGQPFGGSTDLVVVLHEPAGGQAILRDVRIAEQEGFDRIVFEFEGGVPGYRIEYVEPPIIKDPSGMEVQIAGDAFLAIRMEPAVAHDPNTGAPTFEPQELTPALPAIIEAEQTGDFEAVLTWVLGLSGELPFRVDEFNSPDRLTIDVRHP
jgi:hypothetical protein